MNSSHKRFDVVLFDLGDTLMYFDADWPAVFAEARQALFQSLVSSGIALDKTFAADFYERMQAYYRERDIEFFEYTTRYILKTSLDACGFLDTPDQIIDRALADFHAVTQNHWLPEDDLLPTLEAVRARGYRMAAISNAADDYNTQVLIDKGRIRNYFDVIVTSAAEGVRKPNPKIFQAALERMKTAPQRAVMVGDTLGADILGARNAGIYSIWVTRRANTPANRAHRDTILPDQTIARLVELAALLDRLEEQLVS